MPDEHPSGIRIAGQQPSIPVGTAVNLSRPNGHGGICSLFRPHHIVATGAVRHPQSRAADSIQTEVLPKPAFAASTRPLPASRGAALAAAAEQQQLASSGACEATAGRRPATPRDHAPGYSNLPPTGRHAHQFFAATSFMISISRSRSATSFFSRAFSVSSCFRRLTSFA